MLQVKPNGQIEVPTFTGMEAKVAVISKAGKRYALLQDSRTGALSAWSGCADESSIPCELVGEFFLDGTETLVEELRVVGTVQQGVAVLRMDESGFYMYDCRNIYSTNSDYLPPDTDPVRLQAHWDGFAANLRTGKH